MTKIADIGETVKWQYGGKDLIGHVISRFPDKEQYYIAITDGSHLQGAVFVVSYSGPNGHPVIIHDYCSHCGRYDG